MAHRGQQAGANNPNWKGGRTVTQAGYVLIKVGKDHPLADVRGYAYEHRLVASEKLGRFVTPKEEVHHDDETKGNNVPENLIVAPSKAHHQHEHHGNQRKKHPDEPNVEVVCACGCGQTLQKFDRYGRPRAYVSGHNPPAKPTVNAVLAALAAGALSRVQIAERTGKPVKAVAACLSTLKRQGAVQNSAGKWSINAEAG